MLDIVETLQKGGIQARLTLSMQSFNNSTLEAVKRKNMTRATFESMKKDCAQKGLPTYTELILGLPNDSYDSLRGDLEECLKTYQKSWMILMP